MVSRKGLPAYGPRVRCSGSYRRTYHHVDKLKIHTNTSFHHSAFVLHLQSDFFMYLSEMILSSAGAMSAEDFYVYVFYTDNA